MGNRHSRTENAWETAEHGRHNRLSHGNLGISSEPSELACERPDWVAGAAGFEPANAGTKNRCLTTWRRPKSNTPNPVSGACGAGYLAAARASGKALARWRGMVLAAPCPHGYKTASLNAWSFGVWRSLVAHLVRDEGVAGSNPATPTNFFNELANRLLPGYGASKQPKSKNSSEINQQTHQTVRHSVESRLD